MDTGTNSQNSLRFLINLLDDFFIGESKTTGIHIPYDENELLKIASLHRVVPLLYQCLKTKGMPIPSQINAAFWKITALNAAKEEVFRNLLEILNQNNIEPICFKGSVLSETIYGNNSMRQYDDIDLMVSEQELEKSLSILAKNGYEHINKYTKKELAFQIESGWDFSMRDKRSGFIAEISSSLLPHQYAVKIDFSLLSQYSEQKNIEHLRFRILPPTVLLPCLCLHGWKHLWERIGWVADIMSLMNFSKNINWAESKEFANKNGIIGMLESGIAVVKELWPHASEKIISPELLPSDNSLYFAKKCISLFPQDETKDRLERSLFRTLRLQLMGHRSIFSKLRIFFLMLFYPTISDYRFLPLPRCLFIFYPFIRMIRLSINR